MHSRYTDVFECCSDTDNDYAFTMDLIMMVSAQQRGRLMLTFLRRSGASAKSGGTPQLVTDQNLKRILLIVLMD